MAKSTRPRTIRRPEHEEHAALETLVGSLISRLHVNPRIAADARQEGLLGAMEAIRSYDPGRGASLTTHAWWRIRQRIVDMVWRYEHPYGMGRTYYSARVAAGDDIHAIPYEEAFPPSSPQVDCPMAPRDDLIDAARFCELANGLLSRQDRQFAIHAYLESRPYSWLRKRYGNVARRLSRVRAILRPVFDQMRREAAMGTAA